MGGGGERTSRSLAFNEKDDVHFIGPLITRIDEFLLRREGVTMSYEQWEAPVVTKYGPGDNFGRHNDASPSR